MTNDQPNDQASAEAFDTWAVVDVMGHQRYAGRLREITVAGAGFLRLDIPPTQAHAAPWSLILAPGSIHSIRPTTEDVARRVADVAHQVPLHPFEVDRPRAIEGPHLTGDEPDDEPYVDPDDLPY